MTDEDFVIEVSPEEATQAEILPTAKYLFKVSKIERALDVDNEEELTMVWIACQHPKYMGWSKGIKFRDGELNKNNIRVLKACGVEFPRGQAKTVNLGKLRNVKFYAKVQKGTSEEFGVFNRITEYLPFGMDEEDDEE